MKLDYFYEFAFVLSALCTQVYCCTFPQQWVGSWYQRGGEIDITPTRMTTKGSCHMKMGDKYVVKQTDRDGNMCYTCLAITRRHENILQYKESHCVEESSMACSSIRGDARLFTLVRESAHVVPCPFKGPFTFSYANGTGICDSTPSLINVCANPASLRFHFKECFGQSAQNLELTCLATWKNGENYVFGIFTGAGYTTKNLRYRCMTYDERRNTLAVSADATCFGVSEYRDAPVQIELTKVYPDAAPTCSFPAWLRSTTWRDLSGHTVYQPIGEDTIHIRQGPGRGKRIHETTLSCRQTLEEDPMSHQLISYTTHGCSSNYQCIRVSKMAQDGSVLQIQKGKYVPVKDDACSRQNMANSSTYTLIANSSNIMQCPFRGYYVLASTQGCADSKPRCDDTTKIVIDVCNVEVGKLECIASWNNQEKTRIIATTSSTRLANCFLFSEEGGRYRLELDAQCNNGVSPVLRSAHPSYTLTKISGDCSVTEREQTSSASKLNEITMETNYTSSSTNHFYRPQRHIMSAMTVVYFILSAIF